MGSTNEKCLVYPVGQKDKTSLQLWRTADGDQPIRTSPTKIRKSEDTASVPAVGVHPCGRLDNCNTMYSIERHVMEKHRQLLLQV